MESATQSGVAPVVFIIDKSVGRFTVQAFTTGLLSSFGHNPTIGIRDYEGVIRFTPESHDNASIHVASRQPDSRYAMR